MALVLLIGVITFDVIRVVFVNTEKEKDRRLIILHTKILSSHLCKYFAPCDILPPQLLDTGFLFSYILRVFVCPKIPHKIDKSKILCTFL